MVKFLFIDGITENEKTLGVSTLELPVKAMTIWNLDLDFIDHKTHSTDLHQDIYMTLW